jgi:hypothetical protein
MKLKLMVLIASGAGFALVSPFFCFYALRFADLNLLSTYAAVHGSFGIRAVAFTAATLVFGSISWFCLKFPKQESGAF